MIASIIFAFSLGSLLQFGVSYCRSLLTAYGQIELSDRVREIAGAGPEDFTGSDFNRLLQLIRLAPGSETDSSGLRAITAYYRVTRAASKLASPVSRELSKWLDAELCRCSHAAAAALDRRLACVTQ